MKQNFGSLQNEQDWQTHGKHDYNEERKNCNKYNQEIVRDYFNNLYSNKYENLEEMDRFLDTYNHPKQNQEDINDLNRSITQKEIEAAIVSQI
jgi:glutamyl-tRNA reductase